MAQYRVYYFKGSTDQKQYCCQSCEDFGDGGNHTDYVRAAGVFTLRQANKLIKESRLPLEKEVYRYVPPEWVKTKKGKI